MSSNNAQKLITIPTTLRLHVPSDMTEENIKLLVSHLTVGDFGIYPDCVSGSLKEEVVDHIEANCNYDKETMKLLGQIQDVDLWAQNNTHETIDLQ